MIKTNVLKIGPNWMVLTSNHPIKKISTNLLRNLEKRFGKEFKLRILKRKSSQIFLNLKYKIFLNLSKILKYLNDYFSKI